MKPDILELYERNE